MDVLSKIRRPIAPELDHYASLFDEVLTHEETFMRQVLDYVRSRKGKMMRPILVLLLAKECGPIGLPTLRSAVTLELLHTSSLIHDDVIDESGERRGRASLHKVYDNKIAVLLGDYMLAKTLAQSAMTGSVNIVEAVAQLGATLSEGEILQLSHVEQEEISETTYYNIIRRKTAALFAACGTMAALSMNADPEFLRRAQLFGERIGMCFQIRDDIFDYYDDPAIGKPRGNDMAEGKLTLPVIHALNTAHDTEANELAQRVKRQEATPEEIARLIAFAKEHGGIAHAEMRMAALRNECVELIASFRNEEIKTALTEYADFVIGRTT